MKKDETFQCPASELDSGMKNALLLRDLRWSLKAVGESQSMLILERGNTLCARYRLICLGHHL